MITTLREELTVSGFDWDAKGARIIIQSSDSQFPGWSHGTSAKEIGVDAPELDTEFNDGYGGPTCPRFIAEDDVAIYMPWQYDGATGVFSVRKDISVYLDTKYSTPYPGV